ncbi:hypothetical protein H6G97_20625 [Nostoc flagelliforme FACHB-838]|uniref:Uncharacterized protein n=1 Tax=Nostoc flagelliforme FACHB-838 TaxID=2692904 RepID=A0ABR8DRU9_9NOSO|nr:hypothetical protein [Nostoc flagelliforme FACHB-838]
MYTHLCAKSKFSLRKSFKPIEGVYLRFERSTGIPGSDPDYAIWGDYNTEEFARRSQQFTSITRQLQGCKANYNKSI